MIVMISDGLCILTGHISGSRLNSPTTFLGVISCDSGDDAGGVVAYVLLRSGASRRVEQRIVENIIYKRCSVSFRWIYRDTATEVESTQKGGKGKISRRSRKKARLVSNKDSKQGLLYFVRWYFRSIRSTAIYVDVGMRRGYEVRGTVAGSRVYMIAYSM